MIPDYRYFPRIAADRLFWSIRDQCVVLVARKL